VHALVRGQTPRSIAAGVHALVRGQTPRSIAAGVHALVRGHTPRSIAAGVHALVRGQKPRSVACLCLQCSAGIITGGEKKQDSVVLQGSWISPIRVEVHTICTEVVMYTARLEMATTPALPPTCLSGYLSST
jgi:hypothetical protein